MNVLSGAVARRVSESRLILAGVSLAVTLFCAPLAAAQAQPSEKPAEAKPPEVRRTFFLANATQQHDLNDIQTDLRNMLPRARIYGVAWQNAISVAGTAEDIQLAQQIISELDRPRKAFHVTYLFTEFDGGKRLDSQQYSLDVMEGDRSELKQGTKVPIVTGTFSHDSSSSETQTQFEDVGLHIEASIDGMRLSTKIERSSLSDEKSGVGPQDPIIRQSVLQGGMLLPLGKPVALGSLEVPGATRRQEVEVSAEAIP